MPYFLSSPSLVKILVNSFTRTLGITNLLMQCKPVTRNFIIRHILARPRLNLFNNELRKYTYTELNSKLDTCTLELFVLFTERELFLENKVNKLTNELKSIKGILFELWTKCFNVWTYFKYLVKIESQLTLQSLKLYTSTWCSVFDQLYQVSKWYYLQPYQF